jgi:hypothetical protein
MHFVWHEIPKWADRPHAKTLTLNKVETWSVHTRILTFFQPHQSSSGVVQEISSEFAVSICGPRD